MKSAAGNTIASCGTVLQWFYVVDAGVVEEQAEDGFARPCARCYPEPKHPDGIGSPRYNAVVARLREEGGGVVLVEAESPADAFDRVVDLLPRGAKITSILPAVGDITWAVIVEGVRSQRVWHALLEAAGV